MKVVIALALLALVCCKDIELKFKNSDCDLDAPVDGAILMKGKN